MTRNILLGIGILISIIGYSQKVSVELQSGRWEMDSLIQSVSKQVAVKVYYKHEWISDKNVNVLSDSMGFDELITLLEKEHGIYSVIRGNDVWYLLPAPPRAVQLPEIRNSVMENQKSTEHRDVGESTEFEPIKDASVNIEYKVGQKQYIRTSNAVTVRGKIIDANTGEAIIGATLFFPETESGHVSGKDGYFEFKLKPKTYEAKINFLGYQTIHCHIIVLSHGFFEVLMEPEYISLNSVIVSAKRDRKLYGMSTGMQQLSMKTIKEIPVLMGEKDVLKISQMLPGIVSVGEGAGGINVRGGNADQNLFYLGEIPVYNTSHAMGFFSAFNSDVIKGMSVYKGHIPAARGGRISSIFDIETRKGNQEELSMHGGVSPISAFLTADGPIKKEKNSVLLSARSSYSNWILRKIDDPNVNQSTMNFYDIYSSYNHTINEKNRFEIAFYTSYDAFNHHKISDYEYSNFGGSLSWDYSIRPNLSAKFAYALSSYGYEKAKIEDSNSANVRNYRLNHHEVKADFAWKKFTKHSFGFGGALIFYAIDKGGISPYGKASKIDWNELGKENAYQLDLYVDDQIELRPNLSIYGGLRYSRFAALGPQESIRYTMESGEATILDTIKFGRIEEVQAYTNLDIRLSMNYRAFAKTSIKFSYNSTSQYLFMLSNGISISPTDPWKLVDRHLNPLRGQQWSFGIVQEVFNSKLSLTLDGFYKRAKNVVDYRDGANLSGEKFIEQALAQGKQESYGLEFLCRKNHGKMTGWLAYTYSRSLMEISSNGILPEVNGGDQYPSNYDIPHSLTVLANHRFSRRVSLSANFVYKSGRPITIPTARYRINGKYYLDYSSRNKHRLDDYIRTDVSLTIDGNLRRNKPIHSSWVVSIYNLFGRKNPYSVFYRTEAGEIVAYQYSVIGVPITTVTWVFKLGNYASK